ncbi:hypothetical protein B0H11DRAFT_524146 [Mycena galericulata]|nr:hypothetical protein B0H11DRAFT_524146 [Mycena galericulata]
MDKTFLMLNNSGSHLWPPGPTFPLILPIPSKSALSGTQWHASLSMNSSRQLLSLPCAILSIILATLGCSHCSHLMADLQCANGWLHPPNISSNGYHCTTSSSNIQLAVVSAPLLLCPCPHFVKILPRRQGICRLIYPNQDEKPSLTIGRSTSNCTFSGEMISEERGGSNPSDGLGAADSFF